MNINSNEKRNMACLFNIETFLEFDYVVFSSTCIAVETFDGKFLGEFFDVQ